MSESVNLMPFVCKWLDTHSDPQHFKTKEKLRNHIVQHDISSCKGSFRGDTIYICPWKGCNKCQSSIIKLEGIKICQIFFGFASSVDSIIIIIVFCRPFTSTHSTRTIQGNQYFTCYFVL